MLILGGHFAFGIVSDMAGGVSVLVENLYHGRRHPDIDLFANEMVRNAKEVLC